MKTVILLTALLTVGCGEYKTAKSALEEADAAAQETKTEEAAPEAKNPILGTWLAECEEGSITEMRVTENASVNKVYTFADDDLECKGEPWFLYTITRSYDLHDDNQIDYTVKSVTLTPKNAHVAEEFSKSFVYGFESWEANEPKDVTGIGDVMPKKGDVIYSIIKVEGKQLFGGDFELNDGSSEDERPATYLDMALTLQE